MSNLSELLPAGSSVKSADFVAQGTLASGVTVGLRSDGKVEAIVGVTGGFGTETQFENGQVSSTGSCYDTGQDKILVCYSDNGNSAYMTMVVGTMTSGNSISFGTPVVANSAYSNYCIAVFDPTSGKSLIGGQDGGNSYNGAFFAVTISGTTPSVGSKTSLFGAAQYLCAVYNTTEQKILVACNENSNSNYAAAAVATISGTSVSFGSKIVWNSQDSRELKIAYDSVNNNNVCVFKKQANSWGQFGILVVSGTSVSVISTHTFAQTSTRYPAIAYDVDKAKMLIVYQNSGSSSHLWYACVTLSGNSPTTGTAAVLLAATGGYTSFALQLIYHPTLKKPIVNYGGVNSAAGTYAEVAISGTTATLGTPVAYTSSTNNGYYYASLAYNPDQDNILAAYQSESKGEATAFNFASTNVTSFIGITDQAISNAATGKVVCKGGAITNTGLIPAAPVAGTPATFDAGSSQYTSCAFDSNANKVVIAYQDVGNSNKGTAIVGTVSGSSISFGSAVVFSTGQARYQSIVFDSNANKVVIAYQNQDNTYGEAIVGTVSGTSISFGSIATFESAQARMVNAAFDSTVNKVIISYRDDGNSSYGTAIVGTVSGTSISFGTAAVYNSGECEPQSTAYDSNANKAAIFYVDAANSYKGTVIIGTVSGTNISFGSEVVFQAGTTAYISSTFDSANNKVVAAYQDGGSSNAGTAIVGTVSGTSISFGTKVVISATNCNFFASTFDSSQNKVMVAFRDSGNSTYGTVSAGTVSGTSISFTTPVVFSAANSPYIGATFDSNLNKTVLSFRDATADNGKAVVIDLSSALTPNTAYFVQDDGTISTSSTSTKAGTALSTTSLLLTG